MTRSATSWSGSTAGPTASAARAVVAPRSPVTAGVMRNGTRQRYRCAGCGARFDDLTGTVLAGHHRPLRVWVSCLYLMGLNLSNRQIARELDLSQPDVQLMAEQLRHGLVAKLPAGVPGGGGGVEEAHVVAGHKGRPADVAKGGARRAGGG